MEFTKKGNSTHFVLTALILHKNHIQETKRILKAIQSRHFQSGVIDSDLVDNDHIKRKLILEDLLEAPFQIFALVVDKRQLEGKDYVTKGHFTNLFMDSLTGNYSKSFQTWKWLQDLLGLTQLWRVSLNM